MTGGDMMGEVVIPPLTGAGMASGPQDSLARRAAVHRALGDEHRLMIVDALHLGDQSPSELARVTGLGTNLVAFHLDVLEDAGLIERLISEGDRRRRYVRLHHDTLLVAGPVGTIRADDVLFVCTANSARSQLAAALWERCTALPARSAGRDPADRIHPDVVTLAAQRGLDLGGRRPRGYDAVEHAPDLVVSVCDRALEAGLPFEVPRLHWSVPDPVDAGRADRGSTAVARAFDDLEARITWLAASRRAPTPDEATAVPVPQETPTNGP